MSAGGAEYTVCLPGTRQQAFKLGFRKGDLEAVAPVGSAPRPVSKTGTMSFFQISRRVASWQTFWYDGQTFTFSTCYVSRMTLPQTSKFGKYLYDQVDNAYIPLYTRENDNK